MYNIAINKMNNIGISICRELVKQDLIYIKAINDSTLTIDRIAYLLNYDSNGQGLIKAGYCAVADSNARIIRFYKGSKAGSTPLYETYIYNTSNIVSLPLGDHNVEYVFECDSNINSPEKLMAYNSTGVKAVLLCALPILNTSIGAENLIPTVFGETLLSYNNENRIFSIGSPEFQAAGILLSVFTSNEINSCMIKFITPYKGDQILVEGNEYVQEIALSRTAGENIIPLKEIKTIDWIKKCYSGIDILGQVFRTPVSYGSMINLDISFNIDTNTIDVINALVKNKTNTNNAITMTEDALVSSDAITNGAFITYMNTLAKNSFNTSAHITAIYDEKVNFAKQAIETMNRIIQLKNS